MNYYIGTRLLNYITKITINNEEKTIIFYYINPIRFDIYLGTKKIGYLSVDNEHLEPIIEVEEYKQYKQDIYHSYVSCITNQDKMIIGNPVSYDNLKNDYLSLLQQSLILRCIKNEKDIEVAETQYDNAVNWLNCGDFFTAPASTRFHDSVECGLIYHTLKTYNYLVDLRKTDTFKNVNIGEMTLCALVHDWCKINLYEPYMKNVKDEVTGNWVQEKAFKYTYPKYPFGHGETSMYIANKLFNLNLEESLAVRWHMGKWYTHEALNNDLDEAGAKYPLVNMLHFADKLSLTKY